MRASTRSPWAGWAFATCAACVMPSDEPTGEPGAGEPAAVARVVENGIDWNGIDWNGIDWNGIDWNGIGWNSVAWEAIDWNGIDDDHLSWSSLAWSSSTAGGVPWSSLAWSGLDRRAVDWNHIDWRGLDWNAVGWTAMTGGLSTANIDWNAVQIVGVWGQSGSVVAVHPHARPLFVFVRASYLGDEFPLAIPGPGALQLLAAAPDRTAAIHLLHKAWQVAYGPGFYLFAGFDGSPIVAEGHFGLAPSLAGLGPYAEEQAAAWTSMIGNLLNVRPLQISMRAAALTVLDTDAEERQQYVSVDVRAAIGNLIPPPWDPGAQPRVILLRSRAHMMRDQAHLRGACPLDGEVVRSCAGGQLWAIDIEQIGLNAGCTSVVLDEGVHHGAVDGTCWVDLPEHGLSLVQDAAVVPTLASYVAMNLPPQPAETEEPPELGP